jgi:ketosteroid isomerase-like protein
MSEENVELVRRAYAALTRADTDTLNDLAAPELVVDFRADSWTRWSCEVATRRLLSS